MMRLFDTVLDAGYRRERGPDGILAIGGSPAGQHYEHAPIGPLV
jgi:hypothetical protein